MICNLFGIWYFLLGFFMQGMFSALFTMLFHLKFILEYFFILFGIIINIFAFGAFKFYEAVLGHGCEVIS